MLPSDAFDVLVVLPCRWSKGVFRTIIKSNTNIPLIYDNFNRGIVLHCLIPIITRSKGKAVMQDISGKLSTHTTE
jgi:hypothetical protein